MKKFFSLILITMLLFTGCNVKKQNSDKIQIVTTVFPFYDFAKNVAGDRAEVTLLLPTGAEAHSYEPTAQDIVKIRECDLFVISGMGADPWTDNIINDKGFDKEKVICAMEYSQLISDEHTHSENFHYGYDQHVWTSLRNAQKITNEIAKKLSVIDPDNADYYKKNASEYSIKLSELDKKFVELTKNKDVTIVLADRFPFKYFTEDYGIKYMAAYPGCSSESEPSAATVAKLIDKIKKEKISKVYYTETSNGKLPDMICKETGVEKELLHSCHTVSKKQFNNGISYLELMEQNYNTLKKLTEK